MLDFLRGRCKRVYVSYKRLPIDDVISSINQYKEQCVDDVSGSMRWLHERFVLKDELFHTFYEDDSKGKIELLFRNNYYLLEACYFPHR